MKYNRNGIGTAGTYELNGWKIFCNGEQWIPVSPEGHQYRKNFKRVGTTMRFVERKVGK